MRSKELYIDSNLSEYNKTKFGKRLFDIVFSVLALIFFSPFILLIIVAIKLESKGPVIFSQERVGRGYDIFVFYKFRTMYQNSDQKLDKLYPVNEYTINIKSKSWMNGLVSCPECERRGSPCSPILHMDGLEICENYYLKLKKNQLLQKVFFKAKDDPRITHVGKLLRRFHLDEIPQFYNVLLGQMSVVGNRPLPLYEAENLTTDEWAYRFLAPAGITGLWQIHSTTVHNPEERIALDNQYSMISGWWMDIRIIVKTVLTFFTFPTSNY